MCGIAAGITVFEPELTRLKENIEATLLQVERLYIVDNGSKNTADLKNSYRTNPNVTVIDNSENLGIAKALNQMCDAALNDGFEWIMTLDQDSLPEPDLVEKYKPYCENSEIALLTPKFLDDNEPVTVLSAKEPDAEQVRRCNTSASLVRLSAYKEVGGFDEDMFIDCVDFDFCTTLEEHGYKILRVNGAVLHHRLGVAKEVRFFIPIGKLLRISKLQKPFFTYNHSPLRTYYYARNIKYYSYKHRDFIDRKTERRVYIKWLVLKLGFESNRWAKLRSIIKGRRDADKMIKKINKDKGL